MYFIACQILGEGPLDCKKRMASKASLLKFVLSLLVNKLFCTFGNVCYVDDTENLNE